MQGVCSGVPENRTTWCTWCPPWADWSPPPWEIFPFALGLLCWTHPWFEVLRRVWVCNNLVHVVSPLGRLVTSSLGNLSFCTWFAVLDSPLV
ncbi:hypothetical protein AMEX_G26678 [Astyanax mexicanus]|uniref:Uncharacterized protein n=1 Tax=Astyanax mexicanus TaxID=7994 RepID=A0A8T2KL18_ASTMX|nr:hypothetical protein AMEX_G26678 [Astyanax mexicanus]